MYQCKICGKSLKTAGGLRLHICAKHPEEAAARGWKVTLPDAPKCPYCKSRSTRLMNPFNAAEKAFSEKHGVKYICNDCNECW